MHTHQTHLPVQSAALSSPTSSWFIQVVCAAFLGLFVIGGAGLSHIEAIHNAAHDVRHSLGFPCH
ncbi:CbtB domain-containing protein [Roseomonas marmotae]|uniref:CbtB-domain containing protein n=1 Tax=Roseomonas marmotae TaxID=2768161 RepID=A0ABS3KIA4_9PROT|nr:CbtB-domain containing protein [Roseomonas marmotae]MBO1077198.1 CbtB-domain containing protein [Roseomonas marmotae]QTI82180.1 CbtB-domain containing protein [Roseomonas marmotae]